MNGVGRPKQEYLALLDRYKPTSTELVIVAESPPASGLYFYDPNGSPTEPLFSALMRQRDLHPTCKEEGLRQLQSAGWVLVDATYVPVDKLKDPRAKREEIEQAYPALCCDLDAVLGGQRDVPIILIKANVCRLLEPKLTASGFKVANDGSVIPFPVHWWRKRFRERFSDALNRGTLE